MRRRLSDIALAVFAGILPFLAFPPFKLDFMAWVSLVPLLILAKRAESAGKAFWYSYLTGAVFFAFLLYWMVNVTIPGMALLLVILGFYFALFGAVASMVFKYEMEVLILPFLWVVLEYLRGRIFTGFPWGLLAFTQYENESIIQIADILGCYGISFILVLANVAVFSALMRHKRRIPYLVTALAMVLVAWTYGSYRVRDYAVRDILKVSVIQGNIPQELKWDDKSAGDIVKTYTDLTLAAAQDSPDLIIWPETAYPYLTDEETAADEVKSLAAETGIPLLFGMVYEEGGKYYNTAEVFSREGISAGKYHKTHLVPFGEYIPFEKYFFPMLREFIDKPIGDFDPGKEKTLFSVKSMASFGSENGNLARSINFFQFGVLICFEDIFPEITRDFVLRGASFVVNITNDAWFGRTAAAEQHLQASVFRAVENKIPVVRAANTGVSCFIGPTGRVLKRVTEGEKDIFVKGFATGTFQISAVRSFYTLNGDVFVVLCGILFILSFCFDALQKRLIESKKEE